MSTGIEQPSAAELAEWLRNAESRVEPIPPLSESRPDLDTADAYRIQLVNVEERVRRGASVVGHKVGLTSRAMQEMMGVDEPDYGHIFDEIVLRDGDELAVDGLLAPRAEPEIAFVLERDLDGDQITRDEVLASTAYVCPSLEIIDSRIIDWRIRLVDTIADNASCARVVLGPKRTPPDEVDLPAASVALQVDGVTVEQGNGAAVLGHPADAVAWLANTVGRLGVALQAGHLVLPGSMTRAIDIRAGSIVRADFGPLGDVKLSCR